MLLRNGKSTIVIKPIKAQKMRVNFNDIIKTTMASTKLIPYEQRVLVLKKLFTKIHDSIEFILNDKSEQSFEYITSLFKNTFYENTLYSEQHKYYSCPNHDEKIIQTSNDIYKLIIQIRHAIKVKYPHMKRC